MNTTIRIALVIALSAAAACGGGGSTEQAQTSSMDTAVPSNTSSATTSSTAPSGTLTVTLDWIPPTRNENNSALVDLSGYKVYGWRDGEKTASAMWQLDNPGLSAYVVDFPRHGEWLVGMTAVNSRGKESALSNTVSLTL